MKNFSDSRQRRMKKLAGAGDTRGFSLIELLIVTCIGMIIAAFAFITLMPALQNAHLNNAYDTTLTQLRIARERAIAERSRYIVAFGANVPPLAAAGVPAPDAKSVQLWHWAVGTPVSPAPALVTSMELPADVDFNAVGGLPNPGPDNWGAGGTAIDFDQGVGLGGLKYVMFMPDGSSQDELGNYNSGVVYMSRGGVMSNTKAITVFGTTGRVRGWRLNGAAWVEQ